MKLSINQISKIGVDNGCTYCQAQKFKQFVNSVKSM